MKFSKEIWVNKDGRRVMMVDDIIQSHLQKQPSYKEVVELLGVPNYLDSLTSTVSYVVFINLQGCAMVDKLDMKLLEIMFDKDSVATDAFIREYGVLKKSYILGKK